MKILLYEGDTHTQTHNLQTYHLIRQRDNRNDYLQRQKQTHTLNIQGTQDTHKVHKVH